MILLIDSYDSFTYNLYQLTGAFCKDIEVIRNDRLTLAAIEQMQPEAILLSPGPGRPENAGIIVEAIRHFHRHIPILGICLGHQAISVAFGGEVVSAKTIMHGKTSAITHSGAGLFTGIPQDAEVMRYHSLAVKKETLPACLDITAIAGDGEIMALQHKEFPVAGIQFHPESIGTPTGEQLIRNFLQFAAGKETVKGETTA